MANDFFAHFSWSQFAIIALVYTLAPFLSSFRWGKYPDREFILAIRTSPSSAIQLHLIFVILLLGIFWLPTHYYSKLPDWLTRSHSVRPSMLDIFLFVVLIVMMASEEKLIRSMSNSR